jgi:ribonuclease J
VINVAKKKPELYLIPLGGFGEIGKNMLAIEYGRDIIIVDAGVAFPGEDLPGVDLVIPDTRYLIENRDKVRGIFITHGHEDHIGALPYVLRDFDVPIYGTRLTIGLIRKRLEDKRVEITPQFKEIVPDSQIKAGVFDVSFFRVTHSIPDGVGLIIRTPEGIIVHSGDFKLDHTPIDGRTYEFHKLTNLIEEGVLAMICDSTGATNEGYTPSEKLVGQTFLREFGRAEGRIIVATFASNVHRIQQVLNAARMNKRKVGVVGRSMVKVVEAALDLGYLDCPENVFVDISEINRYPKNEIVIITTGSQGEPLAALTRISEGSHRQIQLFPGDTVIISATPIPGNAKQVYKTINNLFRAGAKVIYRDVAPVHVSGHAAREDIKLILGMVKPKYALPFHGEYRHMVLFKEIAGELGIPSENVIMAGLGDKITFADGKLARIDKVVSGSVLIDGLGVGDVGNIVLRDRKNLSENGVVIVVLTMVKETGKIVAGPDILSRGFVYVRDSEELMSRMQITVEETLKHCGENNIRSWSGIKERVRKDLDNVIYSETGRRPTVLTMIMEV